MRCEIDWCDEKSSDWDEVFACIRRTTLLQSRGYATALCPTLGQRPLRGIIRIDGACAGLVQLQEAAIMRRAVHAVILDRGPLWCSGYGAPTHVTAFFDALCRTFPTRLGRRRRFLPEAPATMRDRLAGVGDLRPSERTEPYQTIWCALMPDEQEQRGALKPKWRNMLNKAERQKTTVEWDWTGRLFDRFSKIYAADRRQKGYAGASPDTLARLTARFARSADAGIAHLSAPDGTALAGLLFFRHGLAATFQAGWVSEKGREAAANHLGLWSAMRELTNRGVEDLDLGGINQGSAAGVERFKLGLGGTTIELAGHYS